MASSQILAKGLMPPKSCLILIVSMLSVTGGPFMGRFPGPQPPTSDPYAMQPRTPMPGTPADHFGPGPQRMDPYAAPPGTPRHPGVTPEGEMSPELQMEMQRPRFPGDPSLPQQQQVSTAGNQGCLIMRKSEESSSLRNDATFRHGTYI